MEYVRCPLCDAERGIRVRGVRMNGRLEVVSRCDRCGHQWTESMADKAPNGPEGPRPDPRPERRRIKEIKE